MHDILTVIFSLVSVIGKLDPDGNYTLSKNNNRFS